MNTTESYIHDQDPYDPLYFRSRNIKELQIVNINDGVRTIASSRYFDEEGRIIKLVSLPSLGGWTAYPPLTLPEKVKDDNKTREIKKYKYSQSGILQRIEIYDERANKPKAINHVSCDNGLISTITKEGSKVFHFRNSQGVIERTENQIGLKQNFSMKEIKTFLRDDKDQVVEKKTETIHLIKMMSDSISNMTFTLVQQYEYNSKAQLVSSLSKIEDDKNSFVVLTEFDYLDNDSDLIKNIKQIVNKKMSKNIEFTYNAKNQLIAKVDNNIESNYSSRIEYVLIES